MAINIHIISVSSVIPCMCIWSCMGCPATDLLSVKLFCHLHFVS